MKLRPAMAEDREQLVAWSVRNRERNRFSEKMLAYPLLAVMAAENGKTCLYLPTHPVLMLDSLAPNPEVTAEEFRQAIEMLLEASEKYAKMAGMAEVVFLASDRTIARGAERRGFKESDMKLYRKVLI